jgi:hypothetical protein
VCDLEISRKRGPWPALGRSATGKKQERERERERSRVYRILMRNLMEGDNLEDLVFDERTILKKDLKDIE